MDKFIPLPGDAVPGLPYIHKGAVLYGMFIEGKVAAQQAMLDRTLNQVDGMRFDALVDWVLLTSLQVDEVTSGDPDYTGRGIISEVDVGFWSLCLGGRKGGRKHLLWFPSYLFVDGAGPLVAGREVFGYPKFLGEALMPPADRVDASVKVRTQYFPAFGPGARPVNDILFSVECKSLSEETDAGQALNDVELGEQVLAGHLAGLLGTNLAAGHASLSLPLLAMPMVFLKQFRDVARPGEACYQEVTRVSVRSTPVRSMRLLGDTYEVHVCPAQSHPILSDLGVAQRSRARLVTRVDHDFVVGAGEVL